MRILAAFLFFTRLPLWKIATPPGECFRNVVPFWSLTGLCTAGVMALVLWLSSFVLPYAVAVTLAILSRVLLTGALHEDGLADFFDGFGGGGYDRERVLAIMKDSHIGSYGVIALIAYFMLYFMLLFALPIWTAIPVLFVVDPSSKFVASFIVNVLPYARPQEQSKSKIIYNQMSGWPLVVACVTGIIPMLVLLPPLYWTTIALPIFTFFAVTSFLNNHIKGYTGDCCGALFAMCEISMLIGIVICYGISNC